MASAISEPKSHGNYLPALEMLLELVAAVAPLMNANVSQTNIFFLSDGRPSDPTARGTGDAIALSPIIEERMLELAGACACPLNVHCIGLGDEDFSVLSAMAHAVPGPHHFLCAHIPHTATSPSTAVRPSLPRAVSCVRPLAQQTAAAASCPSRP